MKPGLPEDDSAPSLSYARTTETPRLGEEILHVAVCQAVAILNSAPELATLADGRRVRDILRVALAGYADAVEQRAA